MYDTYSYMSRYIIILISFCLRVAYAIIPTVFGAFFAFVCLMFGTPCVIVCVVCVTLAKQSDRRVAERRERLRQAQLSNLSTGAGVATVTVTAC